MKINLDTTNYVYIAIFSDVPLPKLSVLISLVIDKKLQLYDKDIFCSSDFKVFIFKTPKPISLRVHNVDYILRIEKDLFSKNLLKKVKEISQVNFAGIVDANLIPKKYREFI